MKIVDYIVYVSFIFLFFYFSSQVYARVDQQLAERKYHENLDGVFYNEKIEEKIKFLDFTGIPLTITKNQDEKLEIIETKPEIEETPILTVPNDFPQNGNKLIVNHYVNEVEVIVPENKTTIHKDLKRGVVWNPETRQFSEKGIVFIEGHSGAGYGINYSYFDKLALYYEQLGPEVTAFIKNEETGKTLEYRLVKKEIIKPGEKALEEKGEYQLVLMTCYPRNTTQKRALFYFQLVDIK